MPLQKCFCGRPCQQRPCCRCRRKEDETRQYRRDSSPFRKDGKLAEMTAEYGRWLWRHGQRMLAIRRRVLTVEGRL